MMYGNLLAASSEMVMTQLAVMLGMLVLFYFMMVRPQKKRDKEVQTMRANLEVGDEVITRGGIIGRIVSLKDETALIETGGDRTKIRIALWAIEVRTADVNKDKK